MSKLHHEKGDEGLNPASGLPKTLWWRRGLLRLAGRRNPSRAFTRSGRSPRLSTSRPAPFAAGSPPVRSQRTGSTVWCASPIAISSDFWQSTGRAEAVSLLSAIVQLCQLLNHNRGNYA
jgi:hypothetical protein